MTKVVPTHPTKPLLPPLFRLANVEGSSPIVSFDNVLDISPTRPVNEAAEQENTTETAFGFEHVKSALIEENIASSEPKSPQRQSGICSFDSTEQSEIRDVMSCKSVTYMRRGKHFFIIKLSFQHLHRRRRQQRQK